MTAIGIGPVTPALAMILAYCSEQALLPRTLTVDDVFADTLATLD